VKGYKAFDKDLKCKDFQFEVGKTYEVEGELLMCSNGFHFCKNLLDVYNYYKKSIDTRICEIEAIGPTLDEQDKTCTSKIRIVKELDHSYLLDFFMNKTNSGNGNSGNRNSGDWNSGSSY